MGFWKSNIRNIVKNWLPKIISQFHFSPHGFMWHYILQTGKHTSQNKTVKDESACIEITTPC